MNLNRVTVTISHGATVTHNGQHYRAGDTVEVEPDTADRWVRSGWATRTPAA